MALDSKAVLARVGFNELVVELSEDDQARLMRAVVPPPILTPLEVAERVGIDEELARRLWRGLGMPHFDDDVKAFSEQDVDALHTLKFLLDSGYGIEELIVVTRLVGRAMGRITDATSRAFGAHKGMAADQESLGKMVELSGDLIVYAYRRHLAAAIQSMAELEDESHVGLAVGFADLVAFSRLADDLSEEELGAIVSRFESVATEACIDAGVRLVKIVGDSVMFVGANPTAALRAAELVVGGVESDGTLPSARAGLDYGAVLPRGGDYFGRPVNVASRIATFANPGTIVFSQGFLSALPEGLIEVTKLRSRRLHNVGRVQMYRLGPPTRSR